MNKKVHIFSITIIVLLCVAFCKMSLSTSNDTFYLIKLGENISKSGIDMLDHFSWIPNLAYTYPHWLYSVFLYFIYNNFGFVGIYIENILCYITLALSIYYVNIKVNKNNMLALVTTFVAICSLNSFIVPRSQSFSIIFIFLEVYFINQLVNTGKIKYSVYLAFCSLIIANIHATIWIGFFIFFLPFFGEYFMYLFCKKRKKELFNNRLSIEKVKNIRMLFITFLICFAMGLITPTRICYTYFIRTALGNSQSTIFEHLPLVIIHYPLVIIPLFLFFFVKSKMPLRDYLMVYGIILMSFISVRHLIFYFTIVLFYCSVFIKRDIDNNNDQTFDILERKVMNNKPFMVLTISFLFLLCYVQIDDNFKDDFVDKNDYPVLAVNFIKENLDYQNIKIINHYNDGSYLLFNDIKVFIDSRCDLYLKEFNPGVEVVDDDVKYTSLDGGYDYNALVEKYKGEYILSRKDNYIYFILKNDNRYKEIYSDYSYVLYQKIIDSTKSNKEVQNKFFRYIEKMIKK